MINQLLVTTVPGWVEVLYPVLKTALVIIMIICALSIIGIVLAMDISAENGTTNSITGARDSYFMQNQSSTKEGRYKKLIAIAGIAIAVSTVLYFVITLVYNMIFVA